MAKLADKVKLSLDEARLLVLGSQILLGFQYRAFLERGFESLPATSQYLRALSLTLGLITILLLMWPASYQQLTCDGNATRGVQSFATKVMCAALLPFALALGIDVYTVAQKIGGFGIGLAIGLGLATTALLFWYGWELLLRRSERSSAEKRMSDSNNAEEGNTSIFDKVDHVLTECRVVIPGAQALLGFQLIAILGEGFDKLEPVSRYVHLGSLALIALSTILLMTPAAFHRIVERGETTHRLWRHTRKMLMFAMVVLAAGLAADFYVVLRKVTGSAPASAWAAAALLAVFYATWFAYPFYRRARKQEADQPARVPAAVAG